MTRINITTGKLRLVLRAEFGSNFIDETARVAGATREQVGDWINGKRRPPANLFSEIRKRDPGKALARIGRYKAAAIDTLERDCRERERRIHLARDFVDAALATADTQPKALRQRGRGPAE